MKSPAFWHDHSALGPALLSPLGAIYGILGRLRRWVSTPYRANVPVICVGNIVVGGAGKTPTALALADLLKKQGAKPVFVSRGYGGRLRGPLRVDPAAHTARDVGDEALLLARQAPCWIARCRAEAVRCAEREATHIIMDDGLQNPSVAPTRALLVIDGPAGLGNGACLPAGPLRETLEQALPRVDAVLLIGEDQHNLRGKISKPVISARLVPRLPEDFPKTKPFLVFAGIGRPDKFFATCREAGLRIEHERAFADHHAFTTSELAELMREAETRGLGLLTTEKDFVRLPTSFHERVNVLPVDLVCEDDNALTRLVIDTAYSP